MTALTPPPTAPADRPAPRVVYCVTSHVNPGQVLRLLRAIRAGSPRSFILVHHDASASTLGAGDVAAVGNSHLINRASHVEWGQFNQLYPSMHSLAWAVENVAFDWFVLLSGQDYPAQPLARTEQFLADTRYDGFIEGTVVEDASWHVGPSRYLYHYYEVPKVKGWRRLQKLIDRRARAARQRGRLPRVVTGHRPNDPRFRVGIRPLRSPFGGDYRCYVGSAWWTINRRCAERLVHAWRHDAVLRRHYRRTLFAATESYPQTILHNDRDLRLQNNDLRYVAWNDHRSSGHPDVLGADDFDAIAASGDHFARKFDDRVDGRILDLLDEHIAANARAAR